MADCRTVTAAARLSPAQLPDLRAKAVAVGVSLSASIRQAMARTQTWTAPDCDTIMHRGADEAIERVARLAIPEGTVNPHVIDEVSGDRTVDDPQDLAQHRALGTEQEGQRLAKVNTDHQMGCFRRTGSMKVYSALRSRPSDMQHTTSRSRVVSSREPASIRPCLEHDTC